MARNYAALPYEYKREMAALNDAEFGRLCRALIDYSETGTPIALCGNERFYAERVMMQEDRFRESYDELRQARSEAGKKGMASRWDNKNNKVVTSDNKNKNTETETETNTETNTLLSRDNKSKARVRFLPPTVEEVAKYCHERGNNVDPQQFVDFYASKGWRVGDQQMKDWKAAVRTWESRDGRRQKQEKAQKVDVDMAAALAENRRAYDRIVNG